MHDRRSSTHASTAEDPQHARATLGPGKATLTARPTTHERVPGGALNVDVNQLNNAHHGTDTARLGESAELAHLERERKHAHKPEDKKKLDKQIACIIKHDHLSYETTHKTHFYDIAGRPIQEVPAYTPVQINAGTLTKLKLNPTATPVSPVDGPQASAQAVECVFVFQTIHPDGSFGTDGWMPAKDLPKAVDKNQRALVMQISHERDDRHRHFAATPIKVLTRDEGMANPPDITDMFTYPPPKQVVKNKRENQAKDYLSNLSLNIPNSNPPHSDGKRFGIETTRLPIQTNDQKLGSSMTSARWVPRVLPRDLGPAGRHRSLPDRSLPARRVDAVGREDDIHLRLRADERQRKGVRLDQQEDAEAVSRASARFRRGASAPTSSPPATAFAHRSPSRRTAACRRSRARTDTCGPWRSPRGRGAPH